MSRGRLVGGAAEDRGAPPLRTRGASSRAAASAARTWSSACSGGSPMSVRRSAGARSGRDGCDSSRPPSMSDACSEGGAEAAGGRRAGLQRAVEPLEAARARGPCAGSRRGPRGGGCRGRRGHASRARPRRSPCGRPRSEVGRLGHDRRVRGPLADERVRADARMLLVGDRAPRRGLRRGRRRASAEAAQDRRQAAFHVLGAAAVEPAVHGSPGRTAPPCRRRRRCRGGRRASAAAPAARLRGRRQRRPTRRRVAGTVGWSLGWSRSSCAQRSTAAGPPRPTGGNASVHGVDGGKGPTAGGPAYRSWNQTFSRDRDAGHAVSWPSDAIPCRGGRAAYQERVEGSGTAAAMSRTMAGGPVPDGPRRRAGARGPGAGGRPGRVRGALPRNVGRVFALCCRLAGDALLAEELAQDVFVRAWQKLGCSAARARSRRGCTR